MTSFDPDHHYYSPIGEKISLEEWSELTRDFNKRILRKDEVGDALIITVYHGFVDPACNARLFGTAWVIVGGGGVIELEQYDNEADALRGHFQHVAEHLGEDDPEALADMIEEVEQRAHEKLTPQERAKRHQYIMAKVEGDYL